MIEGPRLLLGSGVLQSSLVSYSCFWLLNFLWDKAPPWLFFLDEKTSFYLEEKSLKPPFVWKVKISFTKAVLTIPQLLQNQKSYKKEKPVILHFPSLRRQTQNVEFTPWWLFPLSAFAANYCAHPASRSIIFWENTENSTKQLKADRAAGCDCILSNHSFARSQLLVHCLPESIHMYF